jgi:hypothetical protein
MVVTNNNNLEKHTAVAVISIHITHNCGAGCKNT